MVYNVIEYISVLAKTLCELMLPTEERIKTVLEYLQDTKPTIEYAVVPITDAFGPSIVDPDMQCIVVSQETLRGGNAVNKRRLEKVWFEIPNLK